MEVFFVKSVILKHNETQCLWKQDIDGNDVSLNKYKGKVMLIVNVASRW